MTAATTSRSTEYAGQVPSMGTISSAADQLHLQHCLVCIDADGRGVNPTDGDGFDAYGFVVQTVNNQVGSQLGGAADAANVEVIFAVGKLFYDGTAPKPGDRLYVVDNQTVSVDSDEGARGFAGFAVQTVGGSVFTFVSPIARGAEALSDLDTAEAAIADLEADALLGFISVPIGMAPAFVDNTTNGLASATAAFTLNPTIDNQPFMAAVALPEDLDDAADVVVHVRAAISSIATDNDVTVVCVAKFNGGANVAPTLATILAVAAADLEFVIPAAGVPAGARSLMLEIDCDGNLDTADAYIYSVGVSYTRVPATA